MYVKNVVLILSLVGSGIAVLTWISICRSRRKKRAVQSYRRQRSLKFKCHCNKCTLDSPCKGVVCAYSSQTEDEIGTAPASCTSSLTSVESEAGQHPPESSSCESCEESTQFLDAFGHSTYGEATLTHGTPTHDFNALISSPIVYSYVTDTRTPPREMVDDVDSVNVVGTSSVVDDTVSTYYGTHVSIVPPLKPNTGQTIRRREPQFERFDQGCPVMHVDGQVTARNEINASWGSVPSDK